MDELWEIFTLTGLVSDYINYIRFRQSGENNAENAERAGSERAQSR